MSNKKVVNVKSCCNMSESDNNQYVPPFLRGRQEIQKKREELLKQPFSKAVDFTKSLSEWAKEGFPVVDETTLDKRNATCRGCDKFDPTAFSNTGKCLECGCSTLIKLKLATASCPLGKW